MCALFGPCSAQPLEISQDVPDVNAPTNELHSVILHVTENLRPVLGDYRDTRQVHDELARSERIAGALPSFAEFCCPGFDDPTFENQSSLDFGVDGCDLQHLPSAVRCVSDSNANAKDDRTTCD
jgi:hypothetical protein